MNIPQIGLNLRKARRKHYPQDDMNAFAIRLGISRATLQKMEAGELSVTLANYYRAAEILNLTEAFTKLFNEPASLFDD